MDRRATWAPASWPRSPAGAPTPSRAGAFPSYHPYACSPAGAPTLAKAREQRAFEGCWAHSLAIPIPNPTPNSPIPNSNPYPQFQPQPGGPTRSARSSAPSSARRRRAPSTTTSRELDLARATRARSNTWPWTGLDLRRVASLKLTLAGAPSGRGGTVSKGSRWPLSRS